MITRAYGASQVMAIATLAEIYDNPEVFRGVVKIRKGLACRMILESGNLDGIYAWFNKLSRVILSRIPAEDPCAIRTREVCENNILLTGPTDKARGSSTLLLAAVPALLLAGAFFYRR